tara:strand:- start:46 stop:1995 length:1950 start_codon:yes stop_codon:yes gene_type:complete
LENFLKNEKSPYLKQHQNNPVNWYPWGKKALEKAKELKKPIFLSVGYASCHWCHVMAHESFENEMTASIMNEKFINIKVDREERPDLDHVFQKSLAILTGTPGGWPLSMFLDENGVPFTGGTYFPPKEIHGRPDFIKVLKSVSEVYGNNREKIINQATQITKIFEELNQKSSVINQNLQPYVEKVLTYLDTEVGGFKGSPKFPQFYVFDCLFYYFKKTQKKEFYLPVKKLLTNVCAKGLYDHLEGGIARYSVDEQWIVPHFEKMLYDNILFIELLVKFYQENKENYFKEKLLQTINFIHNKFVNSENLLGSAYDADSDGIEGKYYVWNYKDLKKILGEDFNIFEKNFYISENGNFENDNILIEKENLISNEKDRDNVKILKEKLLTEREKRNKPLFDDKSQTDLNTFWIKTLVHASEVLDNYKFFTKSLEFYETINKKLDEKIFHCYKDDTKVNVFLEDYTYYSLMLITFYESTGEEKYLIACEKVMLKAWELFFDKKNNLLHKNPINKNDLFVNPIDINDGNIPNGNSIYMYISNKLELILGTEDWKAKTETLMKCFHSYINLHSIQMFSYLKYLDIAEQKITFTFFGNPKNINELYKYTKKNYLNSATFIYKKNEKDYLVVCKNKTCSLPLTKINELEEYTKKNNIN